MSKNSAKRAEAEAPDGAHVLRLLQIEYVDFRQSEHTHFANLLRAKYGGGRRFKVNALAPDCAVMFISSSERIVRIVWDFVHVLAAPTGGETDVLTSRTWRVTGQGTFNPLMVQDVAHQLGLHFVGLPTYKAWLEGFGRRRGLVPSEGGK